MKLTRKELLVGGAAGAALGAAGIYELVDRLADSPTHFGEGREPEQHLLDGMRIEHSEGVEVVIPTRHHQMVTAKIADSPGSLADARAALSEVLRRRSTSRSTGARASTPFWTPGAFRATRRTHVSRATTSRSSSGPTIRSTSRRRRPRFSTA